MSATRHRVVITGVLLQKPAAGRSVARKSGGAADRWDELGLGVSSGGCVQERCNHSTILLTAWIRTVYRMDPHCLPHGSAHRGSPSPQRLSLSARTLRHRLAGGLVSLTLTIRTSFRSASSKPFGKLGIVTHRRTKWLLVAVWIAVTLVVFLAIDASSTRSWIYLAAVALLSPIVV